MDSLQPDTRQPAQVWTPITCTNQPAQAPALPVLGLVTFPARIGDRQTEHTSYIVRPVRIDTRAGVIRFGAMRQPLALGRGAIRVAAWEA